MLFFYFLQTIAILLGHLQLLLANLLRLDLVWFLLFYLALGLVLLNFVGMGRIALALDVDQDVALALDEEGVLEDLVVGQLGLALVEVVHVQLPDERRKVTVFEVLWKNTLAKRILAFDLEAFPSFRP